MPDPDRASSAMSPYFSDASRVGKAEFMLLDPRIRKDDGRRGVAGGGFFHGRVVFPLLSPLGLARGSRAKRPYFSDASRGKKSGIHVSRMLAFASMTERGRILAYAR